MWVERAIVYFVWSDDRWCAMTDVDEVQDYVVGCELQTGVQPKVVCRFVDPPEPLDSDEEARHAADPINHIGGRLRHLRNGKETV